MHPLKFDLKKFVRFFVNTDPGVDLIKLFGHKFTYTFFN
jgi:hypothetical protein